MHIVYCILTNTDTTTTTTAMPLLKMRSLDWNSLYLVNCWAQNVGAFFVASAFVIMAAGYTWLSIGTLVC